MLILYRKTWHLLCCLFLTPNSSVLEKPIKICIFIDESLTLPCAVPESFVRGGPNLITGFLVDGGTEDPNTAIHGPS